MKSVYRAPTKRVRALYPSLNFGLRHQSRFAKLQCGTIEGSPSLTEDGFSDSGNLRLTDVEPFGMGGRRVCFVHPKDPTKCVKVLRSDEGRTVRHKRGIMPTKWRREYNNNSHELRVLTGLEKRIGSQLSAHLPRCYGVVSTDLGPGLVLDLIRDQSGQISMSVRELLIIGTALSTLRDAFDQFGAFLLQNLVLTRKLLDHNLVVKRFVDGSAKMYLIDGFGDPAWISVSSWSPIFGRANIQNRLDDAWNRFSKFPPISSAINHPRGQDLGMLKHRGEGQS